MAVNNRKVATRARYFSETFHGDIWVISYGRRCVYVGGEQQEDERGMRKREKQEREGRKGGRTNRKRARERQAHYTLTRAFALLVAGNTYTATNGNNKRGSFVGDPCQVTMQEACA